MRRQRSTGPKPIEQVRHEVVRVAEPGDAGVVHGLFFGGGEGREGGEEGGEEGGGEFHFCFDLFGAGWGRALVRCGGSCWGWVGGQSGCLGVRWMGRARGGEGEMVLGGVTDGVCRWARHHGLRDVVVLLCCCVGKPAHD